MNQSDVMDMIPERVHIPSKKLYVLALEGVDAYQGEAEIGDNSFKFTLRELITLPTGEKLIAWLNSQHDRLWSPDILFSIKQLDSIGTVIQIWEFRNCQLDNIDFSLINIEETVTITVKFETITHMF